MKLITSNQRHPFITALVAAAVVAGSIACGAPSSGEKVASGAVESAITAVGPDGATYSLPSGTTLTLVSTANPNTAYSFPVDGAASSEAYSIPAGAYSATLSSVTFLNRSGDAGPTTAVTATLTDPQPYQVNVFAGQTTDLTFHFSLATGGTITFSTGTVNTDVSVAFDAGAANGVGATFQLNLISQGVGSGVGTLSGTLTFQVTGPFVPAVGDVCAPISAPVLTAGSNDAAWFYVEGASQSGNGSICFAGGADASGTYVDPIGGITVGKWSGAFAVMFADATPSWGSIPGAGGFSGSAAYLYQGTLPVGVFDGASLKLGALSAPASSNGASFTENNGSWSQLNGSATLQLLP
jgi:hypothetical protein